MAEFKLPLLELACFERVVVLIKVACILEPAVNISGKYPGEEVAVYRYCTKVSKTSNPYRIMYLPSKQIVE
jgi:hypothetical protein